MTVRRFSRAARRFAPYAIAAVMLFARSAGAQSLGLAPAEIRASFKGGEPLRFELTVSNDADTPVTMKATVLDLWFNDRNEKVFTPPGTTPRSAANWIEFVPRDLSVPARGNAKLNVLITPPPSTSGGYYAVLFVESTPRLAQAGTPESRPVFTSMRLGTLVLLSSQGSESYSVDVTNATLTPPGPDHPLALDLTLKNASNTHIFPQAKVAVLSAARQLVAKAESEPKRFFPGQTDRIGVTWSGVLPPGEYVAILTLVYGRDQVYTREFPFTMSSSDAPASAGSPGR